MVTETAKSKYYYDELFKSVHLIIFIKAEVHCNSSEGNGNFIRNTFNFT